MSDSGDVVRRITISATGDGIDSTTDSVNKLGDAFDNTNSKANGSLWADMAAGILGVGAAAGGMVAGLSAALDYVAKFNSGLSDMATVANQVGLSLKDFQGIQFGGLTKGLSTEQINTGLEKSASLLNDASRNANSLSKELEANNISLKNSNGQLISENQLLGISANLIANAKNPGDALAIAQMLGFTKEWLPLLQQGSLAMSGLGDAATTAGAVIDDETIKKASEFDEEWKKSTATFSLNMRAALAGLLPYVDDLIQRAEKFVSTLPDATQKLADDNINAASDALGLPPGGGIKINVDGITEALDKFVNQSHGTPFSLEFWTAAGKAWSDAAAGVTTFDRNSPNSYPISQDPMNAGAYGASRKPTTGPQSSSLQGPQSIEEITKAWDAEIDAEADAADGFSKVAAKAADANDAVDRAINSLNKHIETQKADTLAIGLGDGALASFRASAAETAAVQANGGKETDAQKASFAALKIAASDAADALAKAKVASEISRGSQLAFASPEDIKIANQLKGIYDDDIPAALASSEAAAIRFNDAVKSVSDTAKSIGATIGSDIVNGLRQGNSLAQTFADTMASVSKTLTSKAFTDLLNGNFAQAAIEAAAALATALFSTDDKAQEQSASVKAAQDQQSITDRKWQYADASWSANIDTSTEQGQLQAFDIQANDQRRAEEQAGNQAIVELEQSLAVQRKAIVDKANQQVLQSYNDFLSSIKTGSLSTLSPEDQLKYAQDLFNKDVQGAKNGDQASIDAVTKDAQNLLTIAQAYYASSSGYSDVYNGVTDAINGLSSSGGPYKQTADPNAQTNVSDVAGPADVSKALQAALSVSPTAMALSQTGHAGGGLITNGIRGVDSLFALVAGGEFVTKASSVNASTMSALQYINNTGKTPGANDNSDVARILTQGFNGQTQALSEKLDLIADRVSRVESVTRQANNQRRVPGTKAA